MSNKKFATILALDLATITGWAFLQANGGFESGTMKLDLRRGESPGMRFLRFNRWLKEMLDEYPTDLVIYEQAHHRGGAATELCVGLVTRVQEMCAERGIEYQKLHSATLKKFATGKGNAKKGVMLETARQRWGDHIKDDNEADAIWLLHWAEREYFK